MRFDRPDVVWAVAVRALDAQYRMTSWLRLGCVALMWAVAATLPAAQLPRAALQLALATAGSLLSHAHARPRQLESLERLPGLRRLVGHMSGTRGRAQFNVPGLLEGFGAVGAGFLFAGPAAVGGLSVEARSLALMATVGYAWLVFLNIVLDPGWYAPSAAVVVGADRSEGPPQVPVPVRHILAPGLACVILLVAAVPWTPGLADVPLALRVGLGASPLVLRLAWAFFDQILVAAVETVQDAENAVRKGAAQDLHSLVKNAVRIVANAAEARDSNPSQVRALVRDLLVVVEEARLELLQQRGPSGPRTFAELWYVVVRVLSDGMRRRCRLTGGADVLLGGTDYQLARRVVADLVTNAFNAGAHHIDVSLAVSPAMSHSPPANGRLPMIEVEVSDDGPGMPSQVFDDPSGSLQILRWEVARYGGDIRFADRDGGGAVVNVRWHSPQPQAPTQTQPEPPTQPKPRSDQTGIPDDVPDDVPAPAVPQKV
jgi:hypothetical protein